MQCDTYSYEQYYFQGVPSHMYGTYRQLITGSRNHSQDRELPRSTTMSAVHYGKSSVGTRYHVQVNKL